MQQFEISLANIREVFGAIKQFIRPSTNYLITIREWDKRSLSANALQYVWIKQISEYTGEDIKTVTARCKRDHGLPIALSGINGPLIADLMDAGCYEQLSDDSQLKFVSGMEITRHFTNKEHNDYRDSIQQFWNDNGLMLSYKN